MNKYLHDPTVKASLLKNNSIHSYLRDEYAFSYLLKGSHFPKGVYVYSPFQSMTDASLISGISPLVTSKQSLNLQESFGEIPQERRLREALENLERQEAPRLLKMPMLATTYPSRFAGLESRLVEESDVMNQSESYDSLNMTSAGGRSTLSDSLEVYAQPIVLSQSNQLWQLPTQMKGIRQSAAKLQSKQWNRVVNQRNMKQKMVSYTSMIGKNYAQALQVQLKTQGVQFGKDFLRNTDDGESFSVAIDTYQGIQTAGKSVDVGSKASKYVAKQVNFAPQKMRRAFKQAQWWQQRIFQWWRSPDKLLHVKTLIIQGMKKILLNPVVAIKSAFVALIPIGIFLGILTLISIIAVFMGSGVAHNELDLTHAWEEVTLRDYEETAEIRGVEKPKVDGTDVEPSSATFLTDVDDFMIYMNVKFEDYRLDKAISKKNPETHRAFLNRLYHKVVVNQNPEWQLKNFEEVIQKNDFRLGKKESRYQLIHKQPNPYFDYQEFINPFDKEDKNASISISKRYGYYYNESGIVHKAFRSGIIVDASKGQAVYAPKSGKIRYAGSSVIIETNSKRLRMDNITSFRVSEGNKVKRGTLIGNVARAGGVFIEYKKKQKILWANVNPAFYFPKVNYTEKTTYQASTVEVAGDVGQRALQVYQLFKKFFPQTTINGAAAFLGNFQVESGINPKSAEGDYLNPPVGATATSWDDDNWLNMGGMEIYGKFPNIVHRGLGLGQFTDTLDGSRRNTLIRQFAKKKGKKWYDLELQIEFMFTEDTPYYQALVRRVLSSNDLPSVLANEVLVYWEGNPGDKVAQRQASAIQWAKYLQNPPKAGKYAHAVPNAPTSSGFGWRNFGGMSEFHRGIDYAVPQGTPIHAIADGKVIVAEFHYSWGNHVQILHTDGTSSNYAHQSRMNVHVGQSVKQGDVIGFVGSTGNSTGPHLHLEISRSASLAQGELIDPATVLGK